MVRRGTVSTTVQSIVVFSMLYAEGRISKERAKRIWTLGGDGYIEPCHSRFCTMMRLFGIAGSCQQ